MAKILHDMLLLDALSTGIRKLADILGPNYGPNGRNTVYDQKYDIPLVVNSGKKILPEFELEDPIENMGVSILKDAILKSELSNGDGTIVTTILTNAIVQEGLKLIANGISPIALRKGIRQAVPAVIQAIRDAAVHTSEPDTLLQIASIAADSEKIGQMVADAFQEVGRNGIINVLDSQQAFCRLEVARGIAYDYGFYSSAFANDESRRTVRMENAHVLLINRRVRQARELENILSEAVQKDIPLCIIASDLDDEVVHFILANVHRGVLHALAGHAPGHGDTRRRNMQALAAKTGATVIDEECGLELSRCGLEVCGRAESVFMDKENTNLRGFPMEDPQAVESLRNYTYSLLAQEKNPEEIEKLQMTLSALSGGMATIYAGGYSEYEMFENKFRIENAVSACYSAISTGIVPGGGKSFLLAIPAIDNLIQEQEGEMVLGLRCIRQALTTPSRVIADNAGENGSYVLSTLMEHLDEPFYGYDAASHQFCDLGKAGILDPAGSICIAFRIAAETAATVLTVQSAVLTER